MYAKTFPYFSRDYALANYLNNKLDENYFKQIEEKQLQEEIFYTEWLNSKFINANFDYRINNVCDDLRNGNVLIKIIEVLDNVTLNGQKKNTILSIKTRLHNIANIEKCLNYLRNVRRFNINMKPDDIANGDPKTILSLLFMLKHFYEKPQRHSSVNNQIDASFFSKLSGISDASHISSTCSDDPFELSYANKSISNEKEVNLVEKRDEANQGIKIEINKNEEIKELHLLNANKSTSNEKQEEYVEIRDISNQDVKIDTTENREIANKPTTNGKQEDSIEIKDVCNHEVSTEALSNKKEDDLVEEIDSSNQEVKIETNKYQEIVFNDVKVNKNYLTNGLNEITKEIEIDAGYEIPNEVEKDYESSGGLNDEISMNEMSNTKESFNIIKIEHEKNNQIKEANEVVSEPFDKYDETDIKQLIIENKTQPDEDQFCFVEEIKQEDCVEIPIINKVEENISIPVQTSQNNLNNLVEENNDDIEETQQDTHCYTTSENISKITFETNQVNSVVHELENKENDTSLNRHYPSTSEINLTIPLKSNDEPIEISENEDEDNTEIEMNNSENFTQTKFYSNQSNSICENEEKENKETLVSNDEIATIDRNESHLVQLIEKESNCNSIPKEEISAIQHQTNDEVKPVESNSTFIENTSKVVVKSDENKSDTSIYHKNNKITSQEATQNKVILEDKTNRHTNAAYKINKSETSIHSNNKKVLQEIVETKSIIEDKTNGHDVTYKINKHDTIDLMPIKTTKSDPATAINKQGSKTRIQINLNSNNITTTTPTNTRESATPITFKPTENVNDKTLFSKIVQNSSKTIIVKSSEDLRVKSIKVDVKIKKPEEGDVVSNTKTTDNHKKVTEKANNNAKNNNINKDIKQKDSKSKMNGDGEPNKHSLYENSEKATLNLFEQKIGDCDMSTVDAKTLISETKMNSKKRHFESPTLPGKRKRERPSNKTTAENSNTSIIKSHSSNNMEILSDRVSENNDTNSSTSKSGSSNTLIKQALKTSLISFILLSSVGFMYLVFKNLEKKL